MSSIQVQPSEPSRLAPIDERYLRAPAVCKRYGISPASLYRWVANGDFPKSIKIGPNAAGWRLSDLMAFDADPEGWRNGEGRL